MEQPNRNYTDGTYRYGFQGQEKDDELKGKGNSVNYKYRMHDPRVGRFFAVDPLEIKYPYYSPYQFSGNRLINAKELEGLEEQIVHNQYLGGKIYETVLKKSQFTYVEWKQIQKIWWRSIILDSKRNENNFGGVGFEDYKFAPYEKNKTRFDAGRNVWRGNDKGTLYVSDYHGQMIYGFDKSEAGVGEHKIPVGTLDIISDIMDNVQTTANTSIVVSGGSSSVVAIPIIKITEAIGKIASIEKVVIQTVNGDIKKAIQTGVQDLGVPASVGKLFDRLRDNAKTKSAESRVNWLENIVGRAIDKGLDYIELTSDNKPETIVRDNKTGY